MPNITLNWTTVRRDWSYQLDRLGLRQQDVARVIGVSEQTMTKLVKNMTDGQGLTATKKDKERWEAAVAYVKSKEV